jgi:hypothetical protein
MSQSRNLGAREFALCLVILANAVWLGATILNTAAATPTALADVIKENTIASFSLGKEDDPTTSVELMLTKSDDAPHHGETVMEKTIGQSSTATSQGNEALEASDTPSDVESSSTTLMLDNLQGDTTGTDETSSDRQDSPQKMGASDRSTTVEKPVTNEETDDLDLVVDEPGLVVKRHLETSQALLKADYDERRESGLDIFAALEYIDRMAAEDRYGEFGQLSANSSRNRIRPNSIIELR